MYDPGLDTVRGEICVAEDASVDRASSASDSRSERFDVEDVLRNFLDSVPMPAWSVGSDSRLKYVNCAWEEFTGCDLDTEVADGWLQDISVDDRPAVERICLDAVASKGPLTTEFQLRRFDGQYRWMTCFASPYIDIDGDVLGVVGMCMDMTERRQREEQLAFMATHDSLTGLPNRRMFEGSLERAVQRARRGEGGALLMLDVDNFKSYNDARGHLDGDQALINFSLLLQRHLRAGDLMARIGGDEFAVLLERTDLDEAEDIAERMRAATAKEDFVAEARVHELGISAGLVPVDGRLDARPLFDLADAAMYEAKESGRNRVIILHPGDREASRETERVSAKVREALAGQRFQLYYQPVVRLDGEGVAYYESLVRMLEPDGRVMLPVEFLTTIERLGLMPRLTRQIIAILLQALVDHPEAVVSMNVSPGDLADDSLPRFIEEELRRRNLDPSRLVFEMGEGAVVANLAAARYWLQRLRPLGSRFVLDEFGAGLGLFSLLRDLDFEQVKLDGTIIRELSSDGDSRQFVGAVRSLVESQGCTAVASWVENEQLLRRVKEVGFEFGQGYELEMPDPDLKRLISRYGSRSRR